MRTKAFITIFMVFFAVTIPVAAISGNGHQAGGNSALTTEEEEGLLLMREEEKLARDVYVVLFKTWGMSIFENIAASEQRHMDAVLYIMGKYGIEDPILGFGEFDDDHLQELYNELVLKGEISVEDALQVGVIIELTDIEDIETLLEQTVKKDITRMYSNLLRGSYNHLAAFKRQMESLD